MLLVGGKSTPHVCVGWDGDDCEVEGSSVGVRKPAVPVVDVVVVFAK